MPLILVLHRGARSVIYRAGAIAGASVSSLVGRARVQRAWERGLHGPLLGQVIESGQKWSRTLPHGA